MGATKKRRDAGGKAAAAPEKDVIRAFAALDLDPMSLRRVMRVSDRLRLASGAPAAAWTPAGNLHVTLRFMAALDLAKVAPLGKALAKLAEGKPAPLPFAMRLAAFPSPLHARIVVAELVDAAGALAKLAASVEKLAVARGVPPGDRPYRPHVTLARLRLDYDARRWLTPDFAAAAGDCRVAALTLYRSEPGPDASVYVPLARFPFAPRPA
ncbi:MAG TPA: RNA 2',3'-cyclic phosphodiesterase [Polyangiaceae bacterium]|jgi:2'-5' RNA ligase